MIGMMTLIYLTYAIPFRDYKGSVFIHPGLQASILTLNAAIANVSRCIADTSVVDVNVYA
jgi:hypothetical protein